MKIAFIVSAFPCLSETFILDQITGLIDLGHEVEIFAHGNNREEKAHASIEVYRLLERTHYPPKFHGKRLPRILKSVGLIIRAFPRHPWKTLIMLWVFRRYREMTLLRFVSFVVPFFTKHFDIIHCHFGSNGVKGISLKEIGISTPLLTTFHGHDINSYPKTAGKNVYDRLFEKGNFFTANSEFTKKQMTALGCPENKIDLLPVGLNLERFTFQTRTAPSDGPIRILTVARFVEKKGHQFAIKAIAKVIRKHPHIIYTLAGDGPLKKEIVTLVSELHIKENVKFAGAINQKEIARLYQQTHLFLLASVTAHDGDKEGQGLVLQEAQACGIPIISTVHNGIPEGVLDGKSGYLVPERNAEALAEKIEYLLKHPQQWVSMGRYGHDFVEERYDINILNKRLVKIYKKAEAGTNPA